MKKIWVIEIIAIVLALFCTSCGENKKNTENKTVMEESTVRESVKEEGIEERNSSQASKGGFEIYVEQMDISIEEQSVVYQGTLSCADVAVCGDKLLLRGNEEDGQSGLHIMGYGNELSEKLEIEIPQGMILTNVAVDSMGNIHILLASENDGNKSYELRKLTTEGEVMEIFDVSEHMRDVSDRGGILAIPEGMVIDGEGNYYFDTLSGTELVRVFNKAGDFLCNITVENSNLDPDGTYAVEGMVCGKDGRIYATLAQAGSSQIKLAVINGTTGYLESIAENVLPDMQGRYNYIGQGTDSDLVIASVGNGVYSYNIGDDKAEEKITAQDYPCDMEFAKINFLRDGRLLIMETAAEAVTFHYLPVNEP